MKSWKGVRTTRGEKNSRQAVRGCAQCEKHGELKLLLSAQDAEFTKRSARILLDKVHARKTGKMREKRDDMEIFCKRIGQRGGTSMNDDLLSCKCPSSTNGPRRVRVLRQAASYPGPDVLLAEAALPSFSGRNLKEPIKNQSWDF